MRHRGDVARPRIRFDDAPAEILELLVPVGGGHSEHGSSSEAIHEDDFDLVVTFGGDADRRDTQDLHVLAFGAVRTIRELHTEARVNRRNVLTMAGVSLSRQVRVPDSVREQFPDWVSLLERSVVNQLPDDKKQYWTGRPANAVVLAEVGAAGAAHPVALLMRRDNVAGTGPYRLLLPVETTEHAAWLAMFLRLLRQEDPVRFPTGPDWKSGMTWAPPALSNALMERELLEQERAGLVADIDSRAVALEAVIARETVAAAAGAHRLLAADGADLAAAVSACLTDLGFVVRDIDAELAERTPKLEDLRVTDPAQPGWTALVEVKGYTKGASANDAKKITARPAVQFAAETGHAPDSLWHIVNAHRDANPTGREIPLAGDPATLEYLEQNDGALIDTRDLFQAWKNVMTGDVPAGDLRSEMRDARRRWTYPTAESRPDAPVAPAQQISDPQ